MSTERFGYSSTDDMLEYERSVVEHENNPAELHAQIQELKARKDPRFSQKIARLEQKHKTLTGT